MDRRSSPAAFLRLFVAVVAGPVLAACAEKDPPRVVSGADAARGRAIVERVGCAACHETPDISWPRGRLGGTLAGFGERTMIAGRLPNQPDTLVQWVRDAPSLDPATGMPAQPLTEAEARDVAAYLYTLR